MMGKVRWSELWKKYKFVLLVVLVGVILMLLPVSSGTEEPTAEASIWRRRSGAWRSSWVGSMALGSSD